MEVGDSPNIPYALDHYAHVIDVKSPGTVLENNQIILTFQTVGKNCG